MIKLKDLLSEKIVPGVKWTDSALQFVWNQYFPLTPKIVNILNGGKIRVGAFHITGPNMVNNLKSIQGSKKTISCMMSVPYGTRSKLTGIWQNGILYYVEGDIVFHAEEDIMSRPDKEGRRWIDFNEFNTSGSDQLVNKFVSFLYKDKEWKKLDGLRGKEANESAGRLVARHIELCEKFAEQNKKNIVKVMRGYAGNSPWDEILLNNIELVDCIYVDDSDTILPKDIQDIKNSVHGKAIGVQSLKGQEVVRKQVDKFIKDRGYGEFLSGDF